MSLIIPYTFHGGTSAKAQEVNANFSQIAGYITDLENRYNNYGNDILDLQENKADKNGSPGNKFSVAQAASGYDAVNLDLFNNLTNWLGYLIAGLHITIVNNNSFSIGLGGCGNKENNYVMVNNSTITKSYTNLGVNATYPVWVIGKISDTIPHIANITKVQLSEPQPSELNSDEVYRKIGTITTDSNRNFTSVTKEAY